MMMEHAWNALYPIADDDG